MPRKRRILKEHILGAALELVKDKGFDNFTARRIAEYLNASTQPIYKEFANMDDLKENLLEYVKLMVQDEIFDVSSHTMSMTEFCVKYIRFAKEEKKLFAAFFMGDELSARVMHECALTCLNDIMDQMQELNSPEERKEYMAIVWPAIHGTAVLTAQGQFDLDNEQITAKADHIVTQCLAAWKKSKAA